MSELKKLTESFRQAQRELRQQRPAVLHECGVQLLSLAREAYVTKSQGGTGSDGIQWAKLSRATIEQRVRSRGPARQIVAERKRLAEQIQTTKGKGAPARIKQLRARRATLSARLQALVDAEFQRHAIGIDTGLQLNSSQPGFIPADGQGGGLFQVGENFVTVGFARSYSRHFDEKRKLLPDSIPENWQRRLDAIVARHANQALERIDR